MFKRKAVLTQVLYEEKAVYEAINKLASACNKASVHQLRWAKVEENSYFFSLFGRLAEINWIWSEALKQVADKHHAFSKVFRDIYQEERIVEEARKALQTCAGRLGKLQKQLDAAKKKNDSTKTATLEMELATQSSLQDILATSVEGQSQKLERYKLDLIKKGLRAQSEAMMTMMTSHYRSLIQAQMQLVDLLPDKTAATDSTGEDVEQQMQVVVQQVAESLNIYPPPNGGIDIKKLTPPSPTQSPANFRRSLMEPLAIGLDASAPMSPKNPQAPIAPESPTKRRPQRQSYPGSRPLPKRPNPLSTDPAQPLPENDSPDGYTEIDILEDPKDEESLYAEARHCIVLRRAHTSSADSSPTSKRRSVQRQKHLSTVSLDQHQEAKVLEAGGGPDSSSSEDCTVENAKGPDYAMVLIRSGSSVSESQESDDGGYANPIDALRQCFDSSQNLLEGGGGGEQGATGNGSGEEGGREKEGVGDGAEGRGHEAPHQSFDVIRKLRELQIQAGKEMSSGAPDNPVYSRPFDALIGVAEPLKVTPDSSRRKLNISPLPWQRTGSPSEPRVPRSPLLERQMKFSGGSERLASQGSSSSLTAGADSGSEMTVRTRDYSVLEIRQASEPEFSYLDHPPLPPMRKEQGSSKRPTFNGQPHPAVKFGVMRQRSQSEGLTPEEAQAQHRDTSSVVVVDPQAVSDIYDHENGEEGIKPSDVRAKKVGWLERTVSEASIKTKKLKPVSVKKLRSGQARLISPKSLRKKQTSNPN